MLDALLERKGLMEQIKTLHEMLRACRRPEALYAPSPSSEKPSVDVRKLRQTLGDLKAREQRLDSQLSVRNWQIDLDSVDL